jgi:formylglycine-generating enzyme required for sulfatase activity
MRLFISYARVDRPLCKQIVRILDAHNVWYDHRIHAGQKWWEKILQSIAASEGFVYLISPESATSPYCRKEFTIAVEAGKHIFPVLIHPEAEIPEEINHIQCANLTKGLTPFGVKQLLNAVYIAERNSYLNGRQRTIKRLSAVGEAAEPSAAAAVIARPTTQDELMRRLAEAIEAQDYDRMVFWLKQAKEDRLETRFLNLEALLQEAEGELERRTYLREAAREYKPIVSMVKNPKLRRLGCKAFQSFREHFPDYDPDNIAAVCSVALMPMLEWREIPEGEVTIEYEQKQVTYYLDAFRISRYLVTNAQFQLFVRDPEGYANPRWWAFCPQARAWREQYSQPRDPKFPWGDHPRASVCWYEAMAFCNWLSEKSGMRVTLPTEQQWQRAAQGDERRIYPWGDRFDKSRCNTRESELRTTTPVTRYTSGVSPYGVYDMAGNVWQWCNSTDYNQRGGERKSTGSTANLHIPRAVRGGSFISVAQRARSTFHYYLNPLYRYATIGFRIVSDESG